MLGEIVLNLVANLICAILPLAAGLLLYWVRVRRRLRGFFGITDARAGAVQIRLSNLHVKPGGTQGPMPVRTGFVGPAIIAGEYQYAITLVAAIQSRPVAHALRLLAEPLGVAGIDPPVMCQIDRSLDYVTLGAGGGAESHRPVDFVADDALTARIHRVLAEHRCFVLVGSPVYNVLTYYVLSHGESRVEFVESPDEPGHQASAIKIKNFHPGGLDRVFPRRVLDTGDGRLVYEEYFVIQKIKNWNRTGTTILICAGNSVSATAAALAKLADWGRLAKEFGGGSFAAVYMLQTFDRELTGAGVDGLSGLGAATRVWPPDQ
ncbi:MAG: hypothetical protein ACRDT8_11975 [Micromonosporaceae bacterium]